MLLHEGLGDCWELQHCQRTGHLEMARLAVHQSTLMRRDGDGSGKGIKDGVVLVGALGKKIVKDHCVNFNSVGDWED